MSHLSIEQLAQEVEKSPDYRINRRLIPPAEYTAPDDSIKRIGLMLDVETTGLDKATVGIIEIGAVLFEYSPISGLIYRILDRYVSLNDPGQPIPEHVAKLTGITDEMVSGQQYDSEQIEGMVKQADIVLAHNAVYDRTITERFFPSLALKPWACSHSQIPWMELGYGSSKLDYLLYRLGYFHDGHRAVDDCLATVHILAQQHDGIPFLARLMQNVRIPRKKVWAVGAPFAVKGDLQARGYYWNDGTNGRPKAWWKLIESDQYEAELNWLSDCIYQKDASPLIKVATITPFERFSTRE